MGNGIASNSPAQVLVAVPTEGDARILARCVAEAGAEPVLCFDIECLCRRVMERADVLVVSEEVLGAEGVSALREALAGQPEWSEIPVLLLAASGEQSRLALEAREQLENVLLFSRPVRLPIFESSLRMALRTRRRQQQVRDLLEERQRLNADLEKRVGALRESEERFRRLYEANTIGIASADLQKVFEANDVFLQMIGFTREELQEGLVSWRDLTPREYAPLDDRGVEELMQTGACKPFEKEFLRKDGSRVPVLVAATMLQREPLRWLGIVLELSERKELERRVLQAQKLESVGLLAGGIAHDFNNLLTGILGYSSLALDQVEGNTAEQIRQVMRNAERATHLTRQLLAYSGQGQFVVTDLDVSEAVNEISGMVEFSIPRSVELAMTVQRRLPVVRMDPSQFQQILMNLVINAGEAIGEGNPGRIMVSTSMTDLEQPFVDAIGEPVAPGRYVCIGVSDTGPGIPDSERSKIFDPFYTTKFFGRGLGLAAVAGILRAQRGGLTLETTPGGGSTFRIFLPAANGHAAREMRGGKSLGTVLVVDDEATVRQVIRSALTHKGFQVLLASDGREAWSIFEREGQAIDAVVLDVVMPVMGGNELLPRLKARRPELKVLLTSGYSESEARRLCAAYPGADFIQKPYTAQQIAKAVQDIMAGNGS